jgi:GDP-D-mannose 3',5'-epimerase
MEAALSERTISCLLDQIDELREEVADLKVNGGGGDYYYHVEGVKTKVWPPVRPSDKRIVMIGGGGGFIGSHLAKRLKAEGEYIVIADWAKNIYFEDSEYCNEFHMLDLRFQDNADKACTGVDDVYDLAADMGGMGFIESNHTVILQNSIRININCLASCVEFGVKKFFFSSSACVYPDYAQTQAGEFTPNLKESDAWPADIRSNAYGFEKLVTEEATKWTAHDHPIEVHVARFHNIYGPQGTWKGGREKAPAAFCRKVITNDEVFPMWGDGEQTRSFCLVDDCVEGVIRIMRSDCSEPLNLGSDELISMNDMAKLAMSYENKQLRMEHIPGPQGVRGRNSDNTMIKEKLGWAPSIKLAVGLKGTYFWIKEKVAEDVAAGIDIEQYRGSVIVKATIKDDGASVRTGGGK